MGCRRAASSWSSTPGPWNVSFLSFFTDFGVCKVASLTSHIFSPFLHSNFFSCYSRGAASIADRLGLNQWWLHFGVAWHWLQWTWKKFLEASHRNHPCRLPVPTPHTMKNLPCKCSASINHHRLIFLPKTNSASSLVAGSGEWMVACGYGVKLKKHIICDFLDACLTES